jgi:uncharacterized protein
VNHSALKVQKFDTGGFTMNITHSTNAPTLAAQLILLESDMETICSVLKQFPDIEQAVVFGSRGRGTARAPADVDIAIKGAKASADTAACLRMTLDDDTLLPYMFDVVHYESCKSPELCANIDRDGKVIFQRTLF